MTDTERATRNKTKGLCPCGRIKFLDYTCCESCHSRYVRSMNKNRERNKARCRANYWKNRDKALAKRKVHSQKIRQDLISNYGGKCNHCGEANPRVLQIDHIHSNGAKHRREVGVAQIYTWLKKNNYPKDNYQLLCANCNWCKGIYGIYPDGSKT